MAKQQITWSSKQIDVSKIDKTDTIVQNYKLKTALGAERLKLSLGKFGLAGNVVLNPAKGGRYTIIDGNSRFDEQIEAGVKKIWCSVPNKPLGLKEFKEMAAMFDFAKAGEIDMDRINSELGTTKAFADQWGLVVNKKLLDKAGKNMVAKLEAEKNDAKSKLVKAKDKNFGSFEIVQLMFTTKEFEEYNLLIKGDKTPSATMLKALRAFKNKKKK